MRMARSPTSRSRTRATSRRRCWNTRVPRLSRRLPPHGDPNALSRRLDALRAAGIEYADLTLSNPTQAAIPYPAGLLESLSDRRGLTYEPSPLGLLSAREAV